MADPNRPVRAFVYYLPVFAVLFFWFGGCLLSSLRVQRPHITELGIITLPAVLACLWAGVKVHRARPR